jgi:hypothetical protein
VSTVSGALPAAAKLARSRPAVGTKGPMPVSTRTRCAGVHQERDVGVDPFRPWGGQAMSQQRCGPFRRGRVGEEQLARVVVDACSIKTKCTTSDHGRKVQRSFYIGYLEKVRGYHATEPYWLAAFGGFQLAEKHPRRSGPGCFRLVVGLR